MSGILPKTQVIILVMNMQTTEQEGNGYQVSTTVYEGPLDLLLDLIQHAELDITTIALAQVTAQFLAYLDSLSYREPDEVSAFLVIAAQLVQIKSAALLPRPVLSQQAADEEDPGEALARQLIQYRRFKEIAGILKNREEEGLRAYLRIAISAPKFVSKPDLSDLTLEEFKQIAREALFVESQLPELSEVVKLPRVTIRNKIHTIMETLRDNQLAKFNTILHNNTRIEIVISFIALLELIRRHIVDATQSEIFGDIHMKTIGELDEDDVMEFEFIE